MGRRKLVHYQVQTKQRNWFALGLAKQTRFGHNNRTKDKEDLFQIDQTKENGGRRDTQANRASSLFEGLLAATSLEFSRY